MADRRLAVEGLRRRRRRGSFRIMLEEFAKSLEISGTRDDSVWVKVVWFRRNYSKSAGLLIYFCVFRID